MIDEILCKLPHESNRQYIWRIGQAKDNGTLDLTWVELAPTMAAECDCMSGESVFRKRYAEALAWRSCFDEMGLTSDEFDRLRDEQHNLQIEQIKLRDERNALNARLRDAARNSESFDILKRQIADIGKEQFKPVDVVAHDGDNDLLIQCTDWHIGAEWDSWAGKFNANIARERIMRYLGEILEIKKRHNSQNAYVFVQGDMISGNIRLTQQVANKEDAIEQVMLAAEMLSVFLYELSKLFQNVSVTCVNGNHSRLTQNKDDAMLNERLDTLVVWYARAKLKHLNNVSVATPSTMFDGTLGVEEIRGKTYVAVHGDYDKFTSNGAARLIQYLKIMPEAIVCGHIHEAGYQEPGGITMLRSGSLCGSGGEYEVKRRITGRASQTVAVCSERGIECIYPVNLA